MKKAILTLALAMASTCFPAFADESFSGNQVAAEGAWCWFADPRAIHYESPDKSIDASYLGYIDVHGNVKATQYDFTNGGKRSEVLVRSYFQPDDHNNPTFLVLPDKRVLIIYSRHTDEKAFYYRVSKRPGDISDLGAEKKIVTTANTTYPSPFILSDDPEHFYLCWRGISWHPTIARFTMPDANDDVKADWGAYQIVQSTGARPYAKYYSNGKDKIYVTYTTGHPDNEQPNWVYFNAINIKATKGTDGKVTVNPTLEDIKGTALSVIANGAFNINKKDSYKTDYPATVVDAPSNMRDWVWQVATAEDGNPVIAMVRINGGKSEHDYHYARWTGSEWRITFLANGGGRFHSSNTEYCYSGGMAIDPQNVSDIYLSIPTEGEHGKVYEIWKYTVDANGEVKSTEQITKNSVKNNVRPFVLPGSKGSKLRVAWMNGDYYYWMVKKGYPAGYPTDIRSDYAYTPAINTAATVPASSKTYDKAMTPEVSEAITLPTGNFTVNLTLALSPDAYSGTLFSTDGFKYGVSATDQYPYVEIGGKTYPSSCRFYTSDNWATNSNGTNSDNWPTKIGSFDLSFTYDGTTLTVYRNGIIDQKVAASGLATTGAKAGGYTGTLTAATVYTSCLSQDELRYAQSASVLGTLSLPASVHTDIVLPAKVGSQSVSWSSSHPDILSPTGIYHSPAAATEITMTASLDGNTREFKLTAEPRDLEASLLAHYDFEKAEGTIVPDLSGNKRDLKLMGSAKVTDGKLDLTANKATAFATNGYAVVPEGLLKGLRSYTVCFDATPASITGAPRFYDFGAGASNSLFCRVNTLAAGIKYNGGTTTMVDAKSVLKAGQSYKIAVTYSAATGVTTIYVDGRVAAAGDQNKNEAYLLASGMTDSRNYIGRTQWWEGEHAKDNVDYAGTLDNFRIYDTALTEAELSELQGFEAYDPTLDKDITSKLQNPDFEGTFKVQSGTNVDKDRALYLPESWVLTYEKGNQYDLSIVDGTCLYANLFEGLPALEDGGSHTYRIRQRWGSSTISLCQVVKDLPAAYYTFAGMLLRQGEGVASVFATNSLGRESAQLAAAGAWTRTGVTFGLDGVESVTLGFTSEHPEEVELFTCYDNFTLTDVTLNRSAGEIDALLGRMTKAANTLLAGGMSDEHRTALTAATQAAEARTAGAAKSTLLPLYTALRDAIGNALTSAVGVDAVVAPEAEADGPVYDIAGRRVAPAMEGASLAPGIYLHNGKKIMVK